MSELTDWLAARKKGVTGTDIAAIAGLSPYKNAYDVWLEKRGEVEPDPENEAMYWGRMQEGIIADRFGELHGVTLIDPGRYKVMRHKEHPEVMGTPDRLIKDKEEILEIKTASRYAADQWGIQGTDQIPDSYYAQVQWYMAIVGVPLCHVAVKIDASDYREYVVNRNDEVLDRLIDIGLTFWNKNVKGGAEPIKADGSRFGSKYLAKMQNRDTMLALDGTSIDLVRQYLAADAELKAAENRKAAVRSQLEAVIGTAAGGEGGGYRITWKMSKARSSVDWEKMARKMIDPNLISNIIGEYTTTKPGPRVFRASELKKK